MRRWIILFFLLFVILNPSHAEENTIASSNQNLTPPAEMYSALEGIIEEIYNEFAVIGSENQVSAKSLQDTGISGDEANSVLLAKISNITHGNSSLIVSPENIITAAAPAGYEDLIGTDLSHQPETQFANEKKEPVISNLFYLEEGFYGISVSYPVFSKEDEYLGYTDVTIRPEELIRSVISPFMEDTGYEVMIVQTDGMIIYDEDEIEIGKNTLTDPVYDTSEMKSSSETLLENETGVISQYTFWDKNWRKQVSRQAIWDTLFLDNQEWRVVIIRNLEADGEELNVTLEDN